jgi:hypothetical protein
MSDRLDRIEQLIESNAKAIESLANQSAERDRRTNAIIAELANIVYAVTNRQDDHEHRISRLEDRL